jgi:hypothetical protein
MQRGLIYNRIIEGQAIIRNMAIKLSCDKCKKELADFGGILFSPPDENNRVKKFHLCSTWLDIIFSCQQHA